MGCVKPMSVDDELESLRQQHRRRLVGVVLIALVSIIAVPWLMQQSRHPRQHTTVATMPSPNQSPVGVPPSEPLPIPPSQTTSLPAFTHTTVETVDLPPESIKSPESAPLPKAAPPALSTKEAPVKASSESVPHVAPVGAVWVQVGVFAHHDRVLILDKKLRKLGMTPTLETLTGTSGEMRWRIRVGPFEGATDSGRALKKLESLGIKGIRVP